MPRHEVIKFIRASLSDGDVACFLDDSGEEWMINQPFNFDTWEKEGTPTITRINPESAYNAPMPEDDSKEIDFEDWEELEEKLMNMEIYPHAILPYKKSENRYEPFLVLDHNLLISLLNGDWDS